QRSGHGPASGAQPRLAHALSLLHDGRPGHAHPLWQSPGGVPAPEGRIMKDLSRYFPWIVVGMGTLLLVSVMVPPGEAPGQMHLEEFGTVPVVDRGRVKPIDTFARTQLMSISSRQTFQDDQEETQPAVKWLLEVMTSRLS